MEELPLRDIHLPDPISWWPFAIGYWIVGLLILIALVILVFVIRALLKTNVKKQAKSLFSSIENLYQEKGDAALCIRELSILLRRVVISQKKKECPAGSNFCYYFPRKRPHGKNSENCCPAGLTGDAWLKYLDRKLGKPEFSEGPGRVLITGPYESKVDEESVEKLLQLCRKWVRAL